MNLAEEVLNERRERYKKLIINFIEKLHVKNLFVVLVNQYFKFKKL